MIPLIRVTRRIAVPLAVAGQLVLVAGGCARAQQQAKPQKPLPVQGLLLAPLVGLPIPVLPLTYLIADADTPGLPGSHAAQLTWADSVLAEALVTHGPEATWIFPAELRRVARRAPWTVTDPDHMSQSVMRFQNITKVPDPLFANIRSLIAMTGSRVVMIPAAVHFTRGVDGVKAEAILVLVDARNGAILWRSYPVTTAPTAGEALAATIARVLPDAH